MNELKTVLIVEDDEAIRLSIAELLQEEGYKVRLACDGVQALNYLRKNEAPNLIILDLMMPNIDGFQLRHEQRLEKLHLNVPIVIMSAHPNIRSEVDRLEAKAFIKKPVDIDIIIDTVKKFVF